MSSYSDGGVVFRAIANCQITSMQQEYMGLRSVGP
jgi:hypothetical protein